MVRSHAVGPHGGPVCMDRGKQWCVPAGEHIVMIGDSTMRYQFTTLALALHQGAEVPERSKREPVVYDETTWPSWSEFFQGSTRELGPSATCDCFRMDDCCHIAPGVNRTQACMKICAVKFNGRTEYLPIIENRHVRRRGVQLSFFLAFGMQDLRGVYWPLDGDRAEHARVHSTYAPRWRVNMSTFLQEALPSLNATVVVLNLGFWLGSNLSRHSQTVPFERFRADVDAASQRSGRRIRTVWKTTTFSPKR
mmetsp:Transcript_17400/g.55622  ORF Transcript_17400/g.55622 Transcript_17400/m.55622 type:complete len:251 (-) Transcript_17400:502-1254(-)